MAKQFESIDDRLSDFIARQHIFFTASATGASRVNVSPRETLCLRIISPNTAIYLDRTGSGNETSAHMKADGRLTIMFCAVAGPPMILRLYGRGRIIHRTSAEYRELLHTHYAGDEPLGARQIVWLDIDLVQTSCGFGVPLFSYEGERPSLDQWAKAKGPDGIEEYRREKNVRSMDGLPTGLFDADSN
ncbi:pyridoxamine 5'-phosphate oxidase family protein [Agrobacterium rhizogenes]|uniref:pyridoxamine 5'-phosphate oxidase family protein n=1 Tax=Rhizobium rhizogenes TaxID=359 RepID=UPI0005603D96|nr:pyridoxamine 5'-phosphate oxidase family protein [Rhizobium rhizogenes]NTF79557.1 pyridoxamine 5'-phosphate oxidase family protein [Rhizobium rhizogenes]NTH75650.1 pyridoxamine 5'-phosphate oxidase family protein [Rhizobium rhizogenes]NTH81656.1 pyridoxamine 5'-phosphate oxidase family protein [Rhizobium rhizogenes]